MAVFLMILGAVFLDVSDQAGSAARREDLCTVAASPKPIRDLPEGSGVAVSRLTPGLLWSHNDSGRPALIGLDGSGAVKARVAVTGARVVDWEDVAAGPCAQGSCLYIADIGDNNRVRQRVTIYRVPEPTPGETRTRPAEAIDAVYPDGPRDAEALVVAGPDELFIISKAPARETALYRLKGPLREGTPSRLERVAGLPLAAVTGAALSPDGADVAIRTNDRVVFYAARELFAGKTAGGRPFDLRPLREPQGEGVAMGNGGVVYLVGEGGTLASLTCALR
ncbi:MAG: PE-PGRS family protein [Acidimicrobiia bacterium]|nr:PE-PGRS family protein [Acidimicrobiia bacterium]